VPELETNLARLITAVQACQNRVDSETLARAQAVIDRADRRLSLSKDATVIALAGATGSGKSSVFNAVTRTALAEPGIQRPMTQQAMAVTFGGLDTSGLLDWLGVSNRHAVPGGDLDGIVLLDLVDHDSIVSAHQKEANRLLEVVDEFFWIVDPQKYADAILHETYLRRLITHENVMAFILNQVDRLTPEQATQVKADFIGLLRADGLSDPLVFDVSVMTGYGIDVLRKHMAEVASSKRGMIARLEADILVQARTLKNQVGDRHVEPVGRGHFATVTAACMEMAGADRIAQAVRGSVTRRGRLATGWPWLSWLTHFKPDPLKRLHLDKFTSHKVSREEAPELARTSLVVHPVTRARMDTIVRQVGEEIVSVLPRGWRSAVDRVIKKQTATLPEAIDQAVLSTDVGVSEKHPWWTVVRILQWLVFAVTFAGLVWLTANIVMVSFMGIAGLPTFRLGALPLPTWMVIAGVVVGLLLAWISRVAVSISAKSAAARAVGQLRKSMERVALEQVIQPINAELKRYTQAQTALDEIIR